MRTSDIESGLRLCRAARWNQVTADWELFLTTNPGGCHVAVSEEGSVIGTVATIHYESFSWISMVLVDPLYRRTGIGTRLLHQALATLSEVASVRLDATPAGQGVYRPLGFHEDYPLHRMQRAPAALPIKLEGRPRQMTPGDLDAVFKRDREIFGGDRKNLLEMLYGEAPEYAWVTESRGIDGYLFGRHGYAFEQLGPLVADTAVSAQQLVAACLSGHVDRPFIIDTPLHASWVEWLQMKGFVTQRPFIRMSFGSRQFRERLDCMFAIAGPEFG
jgi:GNAT superfamily N-acetyltransferase